MSGLKKCIIILLITNRHLPPYHVCIFSCLHARTPTKASTSSKALIYSVDRTACHGTSLSCLLPCRLDNQWLCLGLTLACFIRIIYRSVDVSWNHIASDCRRNSHKWIRSDKAGSCCGLIRVGHIIFFARLLKSATNRPSILPVTRALLPYRLSQFIRLLTTDAYRSNTIRKLSARHSNKEICSWHGKSEFFFVVGFCKTEHPIVCWIP
jgi:hypothetical protein